MAQTFSVDPAHTSNIVNALTERLDRAKELATRAFGELARTAPVPASGDRVSHEAARAFSRAVEESRPPVESSFGNLAGGIGALVGSLQGFLATDEGNGAAVQAATAELGPLAGGLGPLAGGLGPLAGGLGPLAGMIPQIAQMADTGAEPDEHAEDEEALRAHQDGEDDSAQGAAFV